MPQTVIHESQAFSFDELSDGAKEKARNWYREHIDENDFSCEIDEFANICSLIGIDLDLHSVNLMGGGVRQEPNIYWSVSCSQGDGACFEGTYDYKATAERDLRAINNDDTWEPIRIAQELARIQFANAFGLRAIIKHRDNHYYHSRTMSIEVNDRRNEERSDDAIVAAEKDIGELMVDLADYLYKQLRDQSDYLYSDEAVDESIEANEYMFDEDGGRHAYA